MDILINANLLNLSRDVWVNLADVMYIGPHQTTGRASVMLRTTHCFDADCDVPTLIASIKAGQRKEVQ